MQSIKLNSHVGLDGILHLDLPVNVKNAELEVIVTVKNVSSTPHKSEKLGWSPGFFEKTAGAWQGKTLLYSARLQQNQINTECKSPKIIVSENLAEYIANS